ncbi:alpha/beta hydrolase [Devosia limi DSM 17137]|uniref:Palmitoyl-protein thioesterase ABHD10, mitochondrial n=1 Tax=Devosia limi DSM 17137 TaxID=1121477 RepID=A0A0F5L2G1_9HYPH|nr:alpha/beta hydrolase [Devosia limi]KKB76399.1 alpha/beta hydrolase [Devosia limi DSM 17137]SHF70564.1 Esterase/lipase [Devosia limi DSM 17137]
MTSIERSTLVVGSGAESRDIAVQTRPGGNPGLFWLGGYRSDMMGSKAMALDALGADKGLAVTRFDYSGHGASGGSFDDGSISRWLEEAQAVFATTSGPQIIVGSSMGGWLALLLVRAMQAAGQSRAKGLVLIAPAVDMTHDLMLPDFSAADHESLQNLGYVDQPSAYSDTPYRITRKLIEDGEHHRLFGGVIETGCPTIILQGGADPDVPQAHAIKLVTHILHDPVTLTLIPDGDHRLSRDQDLALLKDAVWRLAGE